MPPLAQENDCIEVIYIDGVTRLAPRERKVACKYIFSIVSRKELVIVASELHIFSAGKPANVPERSGTESYAVPCTRRW